MHWLGASCASLGLAGGPREEGAQKGGGSEADARWLGKQAMHANEVEEARYRRCLWMDRTGWGSRGAARISRSSVSASACLLNVAR